MHLRPLTPFLLLAAAVGRLPAQDRVELTPRFGFFTAAAPVLRGEVADANHETSIVAGGKLTLWFGRFGVEGDAWYAPSRVTSFGPGIAIDEAGSITTISARALYAFPVETTPLALHAAGGAAVLIRGGDAFQGVTGQRDLAGIANAGLRLRIASAFALRLDADYYISSASFRDPATRLNTTSVTQHDFVLTLGISITGDSSPEAETPRRR